MSLSESITSMRTMLDNCEKEVGSLNNGRKASASRARLSLQQIKKQCHSLRKDITCHTKALPTKTRVKKVVEPVAPAAEPVADVAEVEKKPRKPRTKKIKPEPEE